MTDINKLIETLKELEARATPGPWRKPKGDKSLFSGVPFVPAMAQFSKEADAAMAATLRNALPELLAELERRDARAEKAEREHIALMEETGRCPCAFFEDWNRPDRDCTRCGGLYDTSPCWRDWWASREAAATVK